MRRSLPKIGSVEAGLLKSGFLIAGVDEVGRGCWAGPVYAGAVSLDFDQLYNLKKKTRALIRDSKTLSSEQRAEIIPTLHQISLSWAVASAEVKEIETLGLQKAIYLAMRRALGQLKVTPTLVLVDGKLTIAELEIPQQTIIKGDSLCFSIAAASILAKEARDSYMREVAGRWPQYGFERHVGYGTKHHQENISQFGICPLHRRNFAPIYQRISEGTSQLS